MQPRRPPPALPRALGTLGHQWLQSGPTSGPDQTFIANRYISVCSACSSRQALKDMEEALDRRGKFCCVWVCFVGFRIFFFGDVA